MEPIAKQTTSHQVASTKPLLTTKTTSYQTNKCKAHVHFTDALFVVSLDNLALINWFEIKSWSKPLVLHRTKCIVGEKEYGLLVTQISMEDLFVSKRIDIAWEFLSKFQAVVAGHISRYFAAVPRNQLHDLADVVQLYDITWMLTIVMEVVVDDEHVDFGSRCHYMGVQQNEC